MARRVAFALLLLLLLQEMLLRCVFPVPEASNFDRAHYAPLGNLPDPGGAPLSLAHASFSWSSEPDGFEFVHRLNLHGFRDRNWRLTAPAGSTRIAFVGDSFVEGFSAGEEETIPTRFAELGAAEGLELDVLNLGVGGAGLESYARLLRDAVPLLRPRDVILVLYANDVVPVTLDPSWLEPAYEATCAHALEPRLFHVLTRRSAGAAVPRRWHADPFPFFPAAPDPRNPWSDGRRAGQLAAFVDPEIARAMREGRFNPALTDFLAWFRTSLQRDVDLGPYLHALNEFARTRGSRLLLAYIPTKNQVSDGYLPFQARYTRQKALQPLVGPEFQRHAALLAEACAALGVPFLDLTPALRSAEEKAGPLYWSYDDHLRPQGYRLVSERLFAWWLGTQGGAGQD